MNTKADAKHGDETCPCGSNQSYAACCEPLHRGKKTADTAEALLRARYCAFVKHQVDFVIDTHHSKTKAEVKREEIAEWAKNSEWLGLEISQKEAGSSKDQQGAIVFCARFRNPGEEKVQEHWENALFEKEDGQWRFLDARSAKNEPIRRTEPKVGRNDPCPCNSGKKYKKCCEGKQPS